MDNHSPASTCAKWKEAAQALEAEAHAAEEWCEVFGEDMEASEEWLRKQQDPHMEAEPVEFNAAETKS